VRLGARRDTSLRDDLPSASGTHRAAEVPNWASGQPSTPWKEQSLNRMARRQGLGHRWQGDGNITSSSKVKLSEAKSSKSNL
jgi:hypothetical protein